MLKGEGYCITPQNLPGHEWMGLEVAVAHSTDPSKKKLRGKVVNETRNTLTIETGSGEKKLPKKEVILSFSLGGEKARLEGNKLMTRPENRVKLYWRKYHAG